MPVSIVLSEQKGFSFIPFRQPTCAVGWGLLLMGGSTTMLTALTGAASSFSDAMIGIVGDVAPLVFAVAAGIIGLRLVISLFRQAT